MTAKHPLGPSDVDQMGYDHARWFAEVGGEIKVYIEAEEYPGGPPIDPPRIIVRCKYEMDGKEFGIEEVIDARDLIVSLGVALDRIVVKIRSQEQLRNKSNGK